MENYDFLRIFSTDPEARTERTTAAETGFYILSVIMQTSLWLAIFPREEMRWELLVRRPTDLARRVANDDAADNVIETPAFKCVEERRWRLAVGLAMPIYLQFAGLTRRLKVDD